KQKESQREKWLFLPDPDSKNQKIEIGNTKKSLDKKIFLSEKDWKTFRESGSILVEYPYLSEEKTYKGKVYNLNSIDINTIINDYYKIQAINKNISQINKNLTKLSRPQKKIIKKKKIP